jgi:hypothetical protein
MEKLSAYVDAVIEFGPDTVLAEGPDGTLFLVHRYVSDVPEREYMVDEFIIDHILTESEVDIIVTHGVPEHTTPWTEWVERA